MTDADLETTPDQPVPFWGGISRHRLAIALASTALAVPLVVFDNLPTGTPSASAVEVVAPAPTEATVPSTVVVEVTIPSTVPTTVPPTLPPTTAPPVTAAARVASTTTAPPTTARPTTTTVRPTTTTARPTTTTTAAPPTTAPPPPPPSYSAAQVEAIIRARFGEAGDAAVSIARCESGLNPNARSAAGYYGLFQIGSGHAARFQQVTGRSFDSAWNDPDANSQYARYLYDRSGWSSWGCDP